jgi:hypothetical protein
MVPKVWSVKVLQGTYKEAMKYLKFLNEIQKYLPDPCKPSPVSSFLFKNFFLFIYSHVHTLFGSFLHPVPLPYHFPLPHSVPGRSCFALITDFVEEKT